MGGSGEQKKKGEQEEQGKQGERGNRGTGEHGEKKEQQEWCWSVNTFSTVRGKTNRIIYVNVYRNVSLPDFFLGEVGRLCTGYLIDSADQILNYEFD